MTSATANGVAIGPDAPVVEHRQTFACFGSQCTVIVADAARPADAAAAVAMAKRALLQWHDRFSRFAPDSEISRLNRDQRGTVPVSPLMRRVIEAALRGARDTGGLVDATLGAEIERAGYDAHLEGDGIPLGLALSLAPPRVPAAADPSQRWREIVVERRLGAVTRPAGLRLDPGGIAKGVFADELASLLAGFDAFALDCAGDIRLGGSAHTTRQVNVASPFADTTLHRFELAAGGVATSGIGKRSWLCSDGRPGHHLLDPGTGGPAFTGVVQATALAPTTTEAEVLAKAAVLSGPERAAGWLVHGGAVVLEDGSCQVVETQWSASGAAAEAVSCAHGTTTASSSGESRATTYSAASLAEAFSSTWVSRGGT
jgi:FAD:protein FMN transferase